MEKLSVIKGIFSMMKECGVSWDDLVAYRNNQPVPQVLPKLPSFTNPLPLEVLYSDKTRSFFFEAGKKPVAIICDNIGVAFEDAPRYMNWHDAKAFCEKYSVGGLKWSLPNKESGHLNLLYKNKKAINKVLIAFGKEPLKEAWYWSSSEYLDYYAWPVRFRDGSVDCANKYFGSYFVRPVLAV